MQDDIYNKLARVLDTLPNGFPATETGVEIRLLKKIFTPEQAELFCAMRLTFETAAQVAERTGRPLEGLEERLKAMGDAGQLFAIDLGGTWFFRMLPWVFGIYEFQLGRMDEEMAALHDAYGPVYNRQFCATTPQLMQVLPVEEEISIQQEALPYQRVSALIEQNLSFVVNDCICKKEKALLGHPCDRPVQVCLAMAPIPGAFEHSEGRKLTKDEAYALMKQTEELGLVHLTANVQAGHIYICNCCGCCCGVLDAINHLGIPASQVINSHYYAAIDSETCTGCGICANERCQVGAIEEDRDAYRIVQDRCIGCGLCISACPAQAVRLVHKGPERIVTPPFNEDAWFEEKGRARGVDFTPFK